MLGKPDLVQDKTQTRRKTTGIITLKAQCVSVVDAEAFQSFAGFYKPVFETTKPFE